MGKLDLSSINFSRNDINKTIKLPTYLNEDLAYFIGFHLGDGHMSIQKRGSSMDYVLYYCGHLIDDKEFHLKFILPLLNRLFNIKPPLSGRTYDSTSFIKFNSKAILTFLNKVIGLPIGSKQGFGIPTIIKNSNEKLRISFLRGLADTEFCLSFKKRYKDLHYYPTIEYGTSTNILAKDVKQLLSDIKFIVYSTFDYPTERNGKKLSSNRIALNGVNSLKLWMDKIGFSNTKHLTKYYVWKKFGFCPPYTSILNRRKILKGEINPYSL